ncbi:MAG TPA: hypothetical protein VGI14_11025 [Casimicrobiaceae bacterium]
MKKLLAATAATLLACTPMLAFACDYGTSASMGAAEQLGLAQPPAATKVPEPTVAKVSTPKAAKQAVAKQKTATPQSDRTLVVYRN